MKKTVLAILSFCFILIARGQTVKEYNTSGAAKYKNEDYAGAIEDFTKAIALDASYSNLFCNRAVAKHMLNDYEGALADWNKAVSIDPNFENVYFNRANTKYALKDYEGALTDYNKAVTTGPEQSALHASRAITKYALKDYEGALADYNKAISTGPEQSDLYLSRGRAKFQAKDYEGALADFNKAITINPNETNAYNSRGNVKNQLNDYDGAIADCTEAIRQNSKNAAPYNVRAISYKKLGKYDKAILDYDAAILLNPAIGVFYINIISSLVRTFQFEKAREYYSKYQQKKFTDGAENEARLYFYYIKAATEDVPSKNYEQALTNLNMAALEYGDESKKLSQGRYSNILALKGYVFLKMERFADAETVLQQALSINAMQPDVERTLSNVRSRVAEITLKDKTAPLIELLSPQPSRNLEVGEDDSKTQVIGRAKDLSGILSVSINNNPVAKLEDDGLFITELVLKPGMNELVITATDKQGNTSNKTFTVTCAAVAKKANAEPDIPLVVEVSQKYYAILIAEKDYDDAAIPDLENPVKDARDLGAILMNEYSFGVANIDTLYNRTREDIMQAIVQRCNTLTENDNLVIFYAGHGTAEKDKFGDVDGYWIPVSAKKGLTASYISADDINKALKRSNARHILLIADACFSGAFTRSLLPDADKAIQKQYNMISRKVMASGNMEPVPDNSKFLFYLKKSLKENRQKYISAKDLFDGFYKAIISNSDNLPQYAAIKNVGDEGGEFIFIRK